MTADGSPSPNILLLLIMAFYNVLFAMTYSKYIYIYIFTVMLDKHDMVIIASITQQYIYIYI